MICLRCLAGGLFLAVAAGCSVTEYRRPEVLVPDGWQSPTLAGPSLADKPWGELFDKQELKALIDAALASNRSLHIAAERVELARALYGLQRSSVYPSLSADAAYTRQRLPQVTTPRTENINSTAAVLGLQVPSWEIDLWGRLRSATEAARRQLLASENTRRALEVSVIAQVSTGYLELLELDTQLDIALKTVQLRRDSLETVRTRYAGGIAAAIDVRQAEALVAGAEQIAASVRVRRAQAENNMSVLLGRNPGTITRSAKLSDYQSADPELPAGLPSQLLERRPDILAAEQQLIAAGANLDAARKAYFPVISLTGFLGFASPELNKLFNENRGAWSASSTMTTPIFTGGRLRSNVESAQAEQRIALEQYLATIQNAFREVDNALAAYRWLREQRDALQRLVEANRERVNLADIRYQAAIAGYFEVVDGQQDLFEAELLLAQVTREIYGSVVQLYAALGGGGNGFGQAVTESSSAFPVPQDDRQELPADTAPAPVVQSPAVDAPSAPQDRVEVHGEGDVSIVEVRRVTGIGGVAVSPPASGWPLAMRVRLKNFATLQRFNAVTEGLTFECKLQRGGNPAAGHVCSLNGTSTDGIRRLEQGFEALLPGLFLRREVESFEIRWIDQ